MATVMIRGKGRKARKCTIVCHESREERCTCICGGKYHGIAFRRKDQDERFRERYRNRFDAMSLERVRI